ncbi:MAG: PqqD family peptide modification chaperone [Actinomycetota bacterium]
MTGSTIVVAGRDQVSADLSGEAVILGFTKGLYYGLDEVGARVWALIQEPRTIDQVCGALIEEYEVEPEACRRDILALFEKLADEGLIEVDDAASE